MIKLLVLAGAAAAGYWYFVRRRPEGTLDRLQAAASDAGERVADAAGAARSAASDFVKDTARS